MNTRILLAAVSIGALLLLLAACEDTPPTPSPYEGYLTEEIPPCTPVAGSSTDPCDPGTEPIEVIVGQHPPDLGDKPISMREMLDDGPNPAWVPHVVVRGTYLPGTVRCTAGDPFRPPSYLIDELGDVSTERSYKCYIDVRVNAYILGSGPTTLTGLLLRYTYSVHEDEDETKENLIEATKQEFKTAIEGLFPGREHILFLGPPMDLSSEAWRFLGYWDVQKGEDSTVIAVHPHRDDWRSRRPNDYQAYRSQLEMELPALTQLVTAANQARVSEHGGRIGAGENLPRLVTDANQLRQYYTEVGAYNHPDGTPVPPPLSDA